ncbi:MULTISPECIES: SCP2 sterol-binding domain-containing protein [Anaeromyxobacter]|uniref:SCP2 sterol-binding domain-containing protein n=1 Tax=Anaeromyxobacter TaxID=161492 RepID=UPI001F5752C8|nr:MULTISPECIES: SCP2 sterol-binding domain-containing protein [unclassified Anaeromyxobacter]
MRFGSREWIDAVAAALNRQPDLARALAGLGADAAFVVEAERPAWKADVAAYARHARGQIVEWRLLEDPDDLLELEPAYVVRAPYGTWKGLFNGGDPVKAAISGRVRVEGDLEALVRRSGFRYVVDAALCAVVTEFP